MRKRIILSLLLLLSAPFGLRAQQPVPLSLKQAVDAALEPGGNTQVQLAHEAVRQAEARAAQARADLLPDVSASAGIQSQTRSLAAFGLQSEHTTGLDLPSVVGPFKTVEMRATASQRLFDLSAIRRYQAARTGTEAAKHESESAKNEIAALVAHAYLAAVREQAVVETTQANVELSQALLKLANSQKQAGVGTGIDITRAQVQLANDQQLLLVARANFTRTRLELLKVLGLDLDVQIDLTDRLSFGTAEEISIERAIQTAHESLAALKAQQQHEKSSQQSYSAVSMERLPSLEAFGDYGTVGLSADHTTPTRTAGISIRIPVFDGGRRDARRAESGSLLRQERIRTQDLFEQVELKLRIALDAVHSAEAQVKAAEDGLTLSTNELEQAQRRYEAGVAGSIEVTDAQTRLQRARDNLISAIFNHSLARIDLAAGMGVTQELVANWR